MHINSEPNILYFGTPVVVISTVNEDGSYNLARAPKKSHLDGLVRRRRGSSRFVFPPRLGDIALVHQWSE